VPKRPEAEIASPELVGWNCGTEKSCMGKIGLITRRIVSLCSSVL